MQNNETVVQNYITGLKKAFHEGCAVCPENRNEDSWGGKLPCGQQNCWAELHHERGFF